VRKARASRGRASRAGSGGSSRTTDRDGPRVRDQRAPANGGRQHRPVEIADGLPGRGAEPGGGAATASPAGPWNDRRSQSWASRCSACEKGSTWRVTRASRGKGGDGPGGATTRTSPRHQSRRAARDGTVVAGRTPRASWPPTRRSRPRGRNARSHGPRRRASAARGPRREEEDRGETRVEVLPDGGLAEHRRQA